MSDMHVRTSESKRVREALIVVRPELQKCAASALSEEKPSAWYDAKVLLHCIKELPRFRYSLRRITWEALASAPLRPGTLIVLAHNFISGHVSGDVRQRALQRMAHIPSSGCDVLYTHHHAVERDCLIDVSVVRGGYHNDVVSYRIETPKSPLASGLDDLLRDPRVCRDECSYVSHRGGPFKTIVAKYASSQNRPFVAFGFQQLAPGSTGFLIDLHSVGGKRPEKGRLFAQMLRNALSSLTGSRMDVDPPDLRAILKLPRANQARRKAIVDARYGQGPFAEAVFQYWRRCVVTGLDEPLLLEAAHIKPWSVSNDDEMLDPANGLLLSPSLHAAFDLGLITFSDDGRLIVSSRLDRTTRAVLGVRSKTRSGFLARHARYLKYHRRFVFRG